MKKISSIPKVDKVLSLPPIISLLETHPRPTVLAAVRNVLAALRADSADGRLSDQTAVSPETALLLKVHTSNFSVVGFTAEVSIDQLVRCGREAGIPVMADIGSGSLPLLDLPTFLLAIAVEGWAPQQIDSAFRKRRIPVMGRISKGQYLLDLRTLQDADFPALVDAMSVFP